MTARADCSSTNPNRLPVRLSVEEAVVLLSFGIVEGLVCTSPILQSADPTEEQLRTFKAALQKNRSEFLELLHIRRRIEATGYYSNLLEGLSVKQQRESSKRRATQSHSAGGVGPHETTVGQKELSVRQRRKARREKRKRERLVRHISDEAEYLESAEDDDLDDEFSFNEDHAQRLTIDELLESHTSGAREPAPIVPSRNECPPHEDFNSTIPQHLPRSTPEEWLRSGEVNRLYLPTDVRSDGLYRVALWLLRQTSTRKFAKASQSVQSDCHQLMRCRVFADLWAKGFFVTTSTVKMGGDFLVYQGDPLLYHASHVVALCDPDEPISSSLFSARLRIANSVQRRKVVRAILLHCISIISGLILLRQFYNELAWTILGFVGVLAFMFGFNVHKFSISGQLPTKASVLPFVFVCLAVQIYCEFEMDPTRWHQIRGSFMIIIMKTISLAFDLNNLEETSKSWPTQSYHLLTSSMLYRLVIWLSYALCPAGVIFGPWLSFMRYDNLFWTQDCSCQKTEEYASNFKILFQSLKHVCTAMGTALFCLLWSTCISHVLFPDASSQPWLNAYVQSQSFRFSHYFVSYASEAFVAAFETGHTCHGDSHPPPYSALGGSSKNSKEIRMNSFDPIHVTHLLSMEFPRSLVDVVVSWNLPMHSWLKQYVYKPVRPYGHMSSIWITYAASSLLHGMNFQLSAVLLSIGTFAYIEFVLREQLASTLDACVRSRPCPIGCGHKNKDLFWIRICNVGFGALAVYHLAYLAVMFDTSEQQMHGYSMRHALKKWSDLGFANHYVALATYIFYRCIS
ncbi:unnamed protein product [Calicophoron daubneyi]|uniref:Protein-serine O-palmitoleoyltransferase porcupine n=1 Tax=Calicophoron daubneyi TaxID=300641 RepID=A0AAV2TGK7_CALDB